MPLRPSTRRSFTILLSLLCIGFATLATTELNDRQDASDAGPSPTAAKAPPSESAPSATFSLPPLNSFSIVTEQPIFSPDRKPPQDASDTSGAWSSFVLAGVIITSQSREALVLHGRPPTVAQMQEGQTLEGWTITSIYPDRVAFRDGLDERELRLVPAVPPPNVVTRP